MKGETFPGSEKFSVVFDVHAPTVEFPLNDRTFLSRRFYQIAKFSEPTNALDVYRYLEIQDSTLYSIIDVSPVMYVRVILLILVIS